MKSFVVGVCIAACLIPLDAYAGCRKRFRVKQVVVKQVVQQLVQPIYVQPAVYAAPAPVQVQAAALQPIYQQQVQQVAAVCCCPCPPATATPAPSPPVVPAPDQPPGGSSPSPPAGSELDAEVQAIATRTCVSCHGDTNPKGGISFIDVTRLTTEQRMKSSLMVMRGLMPKGNAAAVSDEEAQKFVDWSLGK